MHPLKCLKPLKVGIAWVLLFGQQTTKVDRTQKKCRQFQTFIEGIKENRLFLYFMTDSSAAKSSPGTCGDKNKAQKNQNMVSPKDILALHHGSLFQVSFIVLLVVFPVPFPFSDTSAIKA